MRTSLTPFEGMHFERRIALPTFLISFFLLFVLDGFFWVLFLLVAVLTGAYLTLRVYHRTKEPWHKIHYPAMVRYSSISGFIAGAQANPFGTTDEQSFVRSILQVLANSIYPDLSKEEATAFTVKAIRKLREGYDKERIDRFLSRQRPDWTQSKRAEFLQSLLDEMNKADNYPALLRYTIAEVVENEYGLEERDKYIQAVLLNKAD